ncbi:MAG TPA: hypothetical protein VFD36_24220 [Kofleriaceae bacterium]|jgi:hypothetical protein|nr:hypothetical protein [Kofleriaceae bacterium]
MIENLALRDLSRLTAWVSGTEITLRQCATGTRTLATQAEIFNHLAILQ